MAGAQQIVDRCRTLAQFSEHPGRTTRTFLCHAMHDVHRLLGGWMEAAGCDVAVDAIGNLRGFYAGRRAGLPRLVLGSHLDTVPDAGAFDGVLGVVLGLALVEELRREPLAYAIELIGFSEEEGVRYGTPFLGSRAATGALAAELVERISPAVWNFGLNPAAIPAVALAGDVIGFLEFHIEQGPVLESLNRPLAVVEGIVGQSRRSVSFAGSPNHAGTTPMHLRRDALSAAAEWIAEVERAARARAGLVATIGTLEIEPGAANVIPGRVRASLDVRHVSDEVRRAAVQRLLGAAAEIGASRGVHVETRCVMEECTTMLDPGLTEKLEAAMRQEGMAPCRMFSGAGHDAMVLARRFPAAMLFLRTPGGISHHPDETVLPEDVDRAMATGNRFLRNLERDYA